MTPTERAERIFCYVTTFPRYNTHDDVCVAGIAAEMEAYASERVEEAYKKALSAYEADGLQIALEQGQREAYEDAAKIAFSLSSPIESNNDPIMQARYNTADAIGQMIRARAAEALRRIASRAPCTEGHESFNSPGKPCDQRIAGEALAAYEKVRRLK